VPGPKFDLDVTAESGQKAHRPLEGNFGEFSSQDFRQSARHCHAAVVLTRADGMIA
jgi:hypothetical protein